MRGETRSRSLEGAVVAALLSTVLAGCGPLTLDVSSISAVERTTRKMREAMTVEESARFDEALFYLVGTPMLGKVEGESLMGDRELELLVPLGGRTAEGIIVEARRRRLAEVRGAVNDLEALREATAAAYRDLGAFRFSGARVYKRNRDYLEWPVIEFKISNDTNHFVSMVHFRAALLKPGDHNPWLVEEFDLIFFEGLAPGESDRWRIEPEQQEWIQLVDPHPDLEFILEARRLEAVGGRVLGATEWGAVEARRLAACERTLIEIRGSDALALEEPPLPSLPPLALETLATAERRSGSEGTPGEGPGEPTPAEPAT
jgi:hypothetical protein